MSHAAAILRILERETARRDRRIVRFAPLHAAIARAHETEKRSAAIIERSEHLMLRVMKRA